MIFGAFIFLVEKREIVRVLLLARGFGLLHESVVGVAGEHGIRILGVVSPGRVLVVLIRRRFLTVADAFMALISAENIVARATAIADVVGLVARVSRSVLLSLILSKGRGCRSHTTLAGGVTSALVDIIRDHL